MTIQLKNAVLEVPAAAAEDALARFEPILSFETDCWDVHAALGLEVPGFVLLDVRSPDAFAAGHIPGALNLPHWRIRENTLAEHDDASLFVVYCAGPHCNGAVRAAIRLARLGRAVKLMPGGITGWRDEGFALEASR